MKQNRNPDDPALSQTLHEWRVDAPLPPRFRERVWQRIERNELKPAGTLWDLLRGWLESKVMRPAVAFSYVAVLLLVGLTAGYWQGRVDTSKAESGWQARYIQSIDPYQASHR